MGDQFGNKKGPFRYDLTVFRNADLYPQHIIYCVMNYNVDNNKIIFRYVSLIFSDRDFSHTRRDPKCDVDHVLLYKNLNSGSMSNHL